MSARFVPSGRGDDVGLRAYLDTNVFIAAYEHVGAGADHARWVLDAIEDGRLSAATSELTLAELLVRPLQEGASALVEAYQSILGPGPGFDVQPVGRDILVEAARVRAGRSSIRMPDAIHIATARKLGCHVIVTDDGGFATRDGPPPIKLGPFTLDQIFADRP